VPRADVLAPRAHALPPLADAVAVAPSAVVSLSDAVAPLSGTDTRCKTQTHVRMPRLIIDADTRTNRDFPSTAAFKMPPEVSHQVSCPTV
jgi:hypothetical protein